MPSSSILKHLLLWFFAAALLLSTLLVGCGPPLGRPGESEPDESEPGVYDQPVVPRGYYDVVFVEPQIIHADSVFTLIRAVRKDSIFVRTDEVARGKTTPSLEFLVRPDTCFVSVHLQFTEGDLPNMPLIARNLPRGFYKVTISDPMRFGERYYRGSYVLSSTVCGRKQTLPVIR